MSRRKSTAPGDRPIIAIGYKYNMCKVISFIATEYACSTKDGIPNLSKKPNRFSNVSILPVSCTLVMSKLFGYVNEFYSHSKYGHSDLALEKYWLYSTVAMGMTTTNFWKLFCYEVKRYHNGKLIHIRKLSEYISLRCFKDPSTTGTGTPKQKIPLLGEVNYGEKLSTCRAINFSNYYLHYKQGITFLALLSTVIHCQTLICQIIIFFLRILLKIRS